MNVMNNISVVVLKSLTPGEAAFCVVRLLKQPRAQVRVVRESGLLPTAL